MSTTISNEVKVQFDNTEKAFSHLSDKDIDFAILMFKMMQSPNLVKLGTGLANFALAVHLPIDWIVKNTVFRQFCGGENMTESLEVVKEMYSHNVHSILDYAVEGANDEKTFDTTRDQLVAVIQAAKNNPGIPVACMKVTGIGRFALLEKVTSKETLSPAEKDEYLKVIERFESICQAASDNNVPVYVDAEESWIQPAIDRMVEARMRVYNKDKAIIFQTLQMYRWDKLDHLKKLISESKNEGFKLGVKFVRGAYMEKENERALKHGYPTFIQPSKEASDKDFNKAIELMVENIDHCEICNGTHNEESSLRLVQLMGKHGLKNNDPRVFFSQLKGMSDNISFNLANAGYNVSKYLPYGPVKSTIPYLTRRAEENTAIAGQMGKELSYLLLEKERRKSKQ